MISFSRAARLRVSRFHLAVEIIDEQGRVAARSTKRAFALFTESPNGEKKKKKTDMSAHIFQLDPSMEASPAR